MNVPRTRLRMSRARRFVIAALAAVLMSTVVVVGSAKPASATLGTNDYPNGANWCQTWTGMHLTPPTVPNTGNCTSQYVDSWGFYDAECVSFIAWRMNNDNGVAFTNNMKGPNGVTGHWGIAYQWEANATTIGYSYDTTPASGSVAWWDADYHNASSSGHVAYVDSVNPNGSINVEEYNALNDHGYDTRTITQTGGSWPSQFIHIKDLSASTSQNPVAIRVGSELYAKSSLTEGWSDEGSGSNGYWKIAGSRIAKWDGNSGLWVKDGPAGSWANVAGTNTAEWSISNNLVAIRVGNELYAKAALGDGWSDEGSASNGYWKIAGSRIAKWDGNSGLWVKDGAAGTWYNVTSSAADWSISSTLVVMELGSNLYAKTNLTDGWTQVDSSVSVGYWKVVGNRFAKWDGNSGLWVKDGMGDSWHNVAGTNTSEWAITPTVVAIRIGSELYAKAALGDGWSDEGSASNGYWKVAGNRLAKWDGNSGLWAKDGPTGIWYLITDTSTSEWAIGEG